MLKKCLLITIIGLNICLSGYAQNTFPIIVTDTTLCKGSTLDLNELILDQGSITSKTWWIKEISGGYGGLGSNPSVQTINKNEDYRLTYQLDGETISRTANISVKVLDFPEFNVPADVILCEGDALLLQVLSPENTDSIWWEWIGLDSIFADNSTFIPNKQDETDEYEIIFRAYGTNKACSYIHQQDMKVTIKIPLDVKTLKVHNNYAFCIGETVDLNELLYFSIKNKKNKEFIYTKNDAEVAGYYVTWANISNPASYKVNDDVTLTAYVTAQIDIKTECGNNINFPFNNVSVNINLKVEGTKPSLTHQSVGSTQNYYPYIICKDDVVEITVLSGSCGTIDTVEWLSPAITHANRTQATPHEWKYEWKPSATTVFTANIKTKNNDSGDIETEKASLTIDVKDYPQLVAITDTSVCDNLNQTIDLNGLLNTAAYTGSPNWGNVNPVLVNPKNNETFTVKATSKYRCEQMESLEIEGEINLQINTLMDVRAMNDTTVCRGSSVTLNSTPSNGVFWSTSIGGAPISAVQTPLTATKYFVNGQNHCGLSTDSVVVNVNIPPSFTLRADTTVCKNQPVNLYAVNFTGDSILWLLDNKWVNQPSVIVYPTQTAQYYAKAFENGCDTEKSVYITVKPTPELKAMDDLVICKGESVQLTATTDTPPLIWNVSNTLVTPVGDTVFYVSVSNGTCEASDSVRISLAAQPSVKAMDDKFVCYGEMVTLTAVSEGTLNWNVAETTFRAIETARYIVTASNEGCADATDTVVITVNDSLYINPVSLPRYQRGVSYNVQLETNAQFPQYLLYSGNLPTGFYLSSTGMVNGLVVGEGMLEKSEFMVEVMDTNGCTATSNYLLEGEVYIPEVFTPNGDGYNDIFMESCHVIIYNRLGMKLFEGNNGWDGTHNGRVLPPDTYFYTVTYINDYGQKEKKSGPISIIKR